MNNDSVDPEVIEAVSRINNELVNTQRELAKANASLAAANVILQSNVEEKETLLKELQHRVKNNMQVISSLIGMQGRVVADAATQSMLKDIQNRIKSMTQIYERLYQSADLTHIEMRSYITDLVNNLVHSYSTGPTNCRMIIDVDDIRINTDIAVPCGLIINEVISNSLKHAFPDGRQGTISISIKFKQGVTEMLLGDDGIGRQQSSLTTGKSASMGTRLIYSLAEHQLGGHVEIECSGGTRYRITFPNNV